MAKGKTRSFHRKWNSSRLKKEKMLNLEECNESPSEKNLLAHREEEPA